jgi:hypothetical protein
VVRVPFLVLGAVVPGRDDRLWSTIDITQGLLEHFGTGARLNDDALSIFAAQSHDFTASATLSSDINREWFLLLYGRGRKFRVNLHAQGEGAIAELGLDGFTEVPIAAHARPPAEIAAPLSSAIDALGFPRAELHREYRSYLVP